MIFAIHAPPDGHCESVVVHNLRDNRIPIMKEVTFSTECPTIQYTFQLVEGKDPLFPELLLIKFSGTYRDGSAGNPDAILMKGIVDIAVELWSPEKVLLGLSDFEYRWGDYIEDLFDKPLGKPLAVVVGNKCKEGLSTLLHGLESNKEIVDNKKFFESREKAIGLLR